MMMNVKTKLQCIFGALLFIAYFLVIVPMKCVVVVARGFIGGRPIIENIKKYAKKYELTEEFSIELHKQFWKEFWFIWNDYK